jgi:hypothetical protein
MSLNHVARESGEHKHLHTNTFKYSIITLTSLGASVLLLGIKYCAPKSLNTYQAYGANFSQPT